MNQRSISPHGLNFNVQHYTISHRFDTSQVSTQNRMKEEREQMASLNKRDNVYCKPNHNNYLAQRENTFRSPFEEFKSQITGNNPPFNSKPPLNSAVTSTNRDFRASN